MPPAQRRGRGDHGASLMLALAFLVAFSTIGVSILSLNSASFKATTITKTAIDQVYGAEAGFDYGVQNIKADTTKCAASGGTYTWPSTTVNGATVTYSCSWVSGGTTSTSALLGQYGAIVGSGGFTVNGSGSPTLNVLGDVYSGGSLTTSSATVSITGDLERSASTCTYNSTTNPKVTGTCTANVSTPNPNPAPTATIPSAAALATQSGATSGCTIFYPGKYTTAPTFTSSGRYYLASGTYYFTGTGDINLAGEIFGGAQGTDTKKITTNSACSSDTEAHTKNTSYTAVGTGVTIILGGNAVFRVQDSGAHIELFQRASPGGADAGETAGVTIWARTVTTGTTGATYTPVTNSQVFNTQSKDSDVVLHGLVYLPDSGSFLRPLANADAGGASLLYGGIVINTLDFEMDNNAGSVTVAGSGATSSTPRTVTISSVAAISSYKNVTLTATVQPDVTTPVITDWRKT